MQRLPQLRLFPLEKIVAAKKDLVLKLSKQHNGSNRTVFQSRNEVNSGAARHLPLTLATPLSCP